MRRRVFALAVLLAALLCGGAQASFVSIDEVVAADNAVAEAALLPFMDGETGLYGYVNGRGEVVIEPEYAYAQAFSGDRAAVGVSGMVGYIDRAGALVIPAVFDEYVPYNQGGYVPFGEGGYALVSYRGDLVVIDVDGNMFSELDYAYMSPDGSVAFERDGLWGFLRPGGQIIEPKWAEGFGYEEGLARVLTGEKRYGFIDERGEVVLDGYEEAYDFYNGTAWVRRAEDGAEGYIDKTGAFVNHIPKRGTAMLGLSDGLALCYDSGVAYDEGSFFVDEQGDEVFAQRFFDAEPFKDGYARVQLGALAYGLIDVHGDYLIEPNYGYIGDESDGLRVVRDDEGKYGYVDRKGQTAIWCQYDYAQDFSGGYAYAELAEGRALYIDTKGKEVFSWAQGFAYGEGGDWEEIEPDPTPSPTPTPMPTPTPAPTPRPTPTPAPFVTIRRGDTGFAAEFRIKMAQMNLRKLGYLSDAADGVFGAKTEKAIMLFQQMNGMYINGWIDEGTYERLSSTSAIALADAEGTLVIESGARGEWKTRKNDKFDFRVQVTNVDKKRTVKKYKLYYYMYDYSGNRYPDVGHYYKVFDQKVAPGKTKYGSYVSFENRSRMDTVWVGVGEAYYTDGTSYERTAEEIGYLQWTLDW